jgi:hypothetical protein
MAHQTGNSDNPINIGGGTSAIKVGSSLGPAGEPGVQMGPDVLLYRSAAGVMTSTAAIQSIGGVGSATHFGTYGVPASLTAGTDTTPVSGTVFYGEVVIPVGATLTGIGYLIGSVGGTDKAIVALYDSTGAVVANSALAGVTVGTTATYQEIPFTATYAAKGPGQYFVSVSMNGTTARLRTIPAGAFAPASSATGVFGTLAAITPPTTFTAAKAPVAYTY